LHNEQLSRAGLQSCKSKAQLNQPLLRRFGCAFFYSEKGNAKEMNLLELPPRPPVAVPARTARVECGASYLTVPLTPPHRS